jgi:hypothetical protein
MRAPPDRGERTGILVIRVWLEPDGPVRLRARLTQVADLDQPPAKVAAAADVRGVCDAVEAWLRAFLRRPAP